MAQALSKAAAAAKAQDAPAEQPSTQGVALRHEARFCLEVDRRTAVQLHQMAAAAGPVVISCELHNADKLVELVFACCSPHPNIFCTRGSTPWTVRQSTERGTFQSGVTASPEYQRLQCREYGFRLPGDRNGPPSTRPVARDLEEPGFSQGQRRRQPNRQMAFGMQILYGRGVLDALSNMTHVLVLETFHKVKPL